MPSDGNSLLSAYPSPKLTVRCECGLAVRYDRDAMLSAGGDRPLPDLLARIASRHGCARAGRPGADPYSRCNAVFAELAAKKV